MQLINTKEELNKIITSSVITTKHMHGSEKSQILHKYDHPIQNVMENGIYVQNLKNN